MNGAELVIKLLKEPRLAKKMGKAGHEHVKKNFLITRLLHDYLKLLKQYTKIGGV